MIRSLFPAAAACALAAPLLTAGCGGAAPSPVNTGAEASRTMEDLSTPEAAAATVDRAERTIDQLLGPSQSFTISQQAGAAPAPPSQGYAQPPPPPPPPAASVAPTVPPRPDSRPESPAPDYRASKKAIEPPRGGAAEACTTACSALASMERAADHLCTLAGATDPRCTTARTRVQSASARVHAACPVCSS
jgi:hypothetical protein